MSASGKAKLKKNAFFSDVQRYRHHFDSKCVLCSEGHAISQADSELEMISFFVEVEEQQYFNHLQLRQVLLKLLPF